MASEPSQELCRDCLNRNTCDYIPEEGRLIRCLDRIIAEGEELGDPQALSAMPATEM